MKPAKKIELEVLEVYDSWLHSYVNGDVPTYNKHLDDDYHFIGSTNNEEFLSRKDTTQFFLETADQFAGKTELRNETKTIEQFGELVFITHVFDAWFLNGKEWVYYSRFRFSSALRKNKDSWRFIYQHFSVPDSKTGDGETIGYEKINEENQELREAIKRRTFELQAKNRELEIEGALGRIRAQAVAMKESSDLLDIVVTMRDEFIKLGHEAHYFWHMMWLPEKYEKAMTSGDGTRIGFVMELPRHIHGNIPLLANWEKSDDPIVIYPMDAEVAIDYVDKMINLGDFQNIDPQAPTHDDVRHIGGLTFIMARTSHGEIGYSLPGVVKNPPKEDLDILIKFAGAFDLAHRRFLDLQKAEKQARETQIELALEKVRSRTMAMQHSDELQEASFLLDQQVRALGIKTWGCAFNIYGEKDSTEWFGNEAGVLPTYTVPRAGIFKEYYQKGQKGESLIIKEFSGKECVDHYEYMSSLPVIGDVLKNLKKANKGFPTYQIDHVVYFKYGYLLFITKEHAPEAHDVFKRFAKVFEQTYTRFLDLQKAEAQARESEIELALERVRARSMAMQKSEELKDVIKIVYQQLTHLKINLNHSGFVVDYTPKGDWHFWIADEQDIPSKISHPYFESVWANQFNEAKEKGDDFFTTKLNFEEKNKFYNELLLFVPGLSEASKDFYLSCPGLAASTVLLDNVGLYIENFEGTPYSEEENKILMRFGKVFQQTYTRFLDLQKAEAQAREAEIENALEKVRSRTMAMQQSDELPEAANNLFLQVQALGIPAWSAGYCIWENDKKSSSCNMSSEGEIQKGFSLPTIGEGYNFNKPLKNGENFHVAELGGKKLVKHYNFMKTLPVVGEIFEEFDKKGISLPTFQIFHIVYFTKGYLMFITYEAVPNDWDIFKRFGRVFEQTYTRFLDLKKAEAQAKEAKIEASLEKVRTVALSMRKSDEMLEIAQVLYEQLLELGFNKMRNAIIDIDNDDNETFLDYDYSHEMSGTVTLMSYRDDPSLQEQFRKMVSSTDEFFEIILEGQTLQDLIDMRLKNGEAEDPRLRQTDQLCYTMFSFGNGSIGISNFGILSDYQKNILERFRNVFTFAYKRYSDLAQAEAQARESQIEAALEKVRSRSLAMHKPEELQEVVALVAEKLQELGVIFDAGGVILCTYFPDNKDVMHWIAVSDFSSSGSYLVPYFDNPIFNDAWDSKNRGDAYFSKEFPVEVKNSFFLHAFEHSDYKQFPDDYKQHVLQAEKHMLTAAWSKNSAILIPSLTGVVPSETDAEIIKRFAKVFEQAYIRFMDLQKAEDLTKKSKIEVALERVRARALAMQQPEELKEVADVLRTEMGLLGIEELETCSIYIHDKATEQTECWYALKDLRSKKKKLVNDHFKLDLNDTWVGEKMLKFYNAKKEYASIEMTGKNRVEWIRYCEEHSAPFRGHYGEVIPDRTYHLHKFSHGAIGVATPGDISEENWELLRRAASVFSLAYSRFKDLTQSKEDLQQLKTEKHRAEEALNELQQTQKQLIQSEKMASLGELTAGIAHEIQNPLNFVNNFSEVSNELMDEMNEEIEKGDLEEAKLIASDIKQNLEKINHHGKRADAIVKGMLQHSRKSTAEKEPTDINKLADEYLRLAYHGLRAKDKSFNATLVTDFDKSVGLVSVIPQDMGRVILNLITNAFYVVNEKKLALKEGSYQPTVSVFTKKTDAQVTISVKDNANGIPKHVLDKIFQPFFTTKPTGQGTGLGLSMSYDIIKAHGGELRVKTKVNEGTEFIIQISSDRSDRGKPIL